MKRIAKPLSALLLSATLVGGGAYAATGSAAPFGPPVKDCSKLKKAAKKACVTKNAGVRALFGQIKNARFTGTHGGGTSIDALFCASGRWSIVVTIPGMEPTTYTGPRWKLSEYFVAPNRRYMSATVEGSRKNIYTQVPLQRRGTRWHLWRGNSTLSAPVAIRTSAAADCRAL